MKKIILLVLTGLLCSGCSWFVRSGETSKVSSEISMNSVPDLSFYAHISNKKIAWGLGKDLDANGQPRDASEANKTYARYDAIFVGPVNKKIYLSFDNGYENGNTHTILDVLKEKNVKAIFFLTGGYVKDNKELVQRMINEGHIIGNHGYLHKSFPDITIKEVYEEIEKLDAYVRKEFNYPMYLIRPPMGEFSERSLALSKSLGYQSVLWSFAYYDYNVDNQPNQSKALEKLLNAAHPGAIYLMHSISNTNTKILSAFIDGLRAKGYVVSNYDLLSPNSIVSATEEECLTIRYNIHCSN